MSVADPEQVRVDIAALDEVAGVELIESLDGRATLQVFAVHGAALAMPVSELSRLRGWQVHGLSVERGRLDEVFRDITRGAGHGDV
jgi:ABC-2 type transport system ATP-binding protein